MQAVTGTAEKLKDGVKESLLGTEDEPQLSQQTRAHFMQHAIKDPESGEHYMTEKEFVDAVAPEGEDYVSITCSECGHFNGTALGSTRRSHWAFQADFFISTRSSVSSTPCYFALPTAPTRIA